MNGPTNAIRATSIIPSETISKQVDINHSPTTTNEIADKKSIRLTTGKSQEDLYNKYKLTNGFNNNSGVNIANPNQYQDKITDQKFFNREYKFKTLENYNSNNSNDYNLLVSRYNSNNTPIDINSAYTASRLNSAELNKVYMNNMHSTQPNSANNSVPLNKLKLLKKRNAAKKGVSSTATVQTTTIISSSPIGRTTMENSMNSASKDDFKSQISLNNLIPNRPLSVHLSRTSINNLDNFGSNPHSLHKSSETIDELGLKEKNILRTAFNANNPTRTKSENEINNSDYKINVLQSSTNNLKRAKSKNEIENENKYNKSTINYGYTNRVKTSFPATNSNTNLNNLNAITNRSTNRLDNNQSRSYNYSGKMNDQIKQQQQQQQQQHHHQPQHENKFNKPKTYQNNDNDHLNHNNDFKLIYNTGHNSELIRNMNYEELMLEYPEPNPNNIMSDPVISEQFRKLYEEDEYFQQVHKKCCEWLNKYVFAEMDRVDVE
jgi:hypothetical protein